MRFLARVVRRAASTTIDVGAPVALQVQWSGERPRVDSRPARRPWPTRHSRHRSGARRARRPSPPSAQSVTSRRARPATPLPRAASVTEIAVSPWPASSSRSTIPAIPRNSPSSDRIAKPAREPSATLPRTAPTHVASNPCGGSSGTRVLRMISGSRTSRREMRCVARVERLQPNRIVRERRRRACQAPWHFLYFLPEPHQHGSFRPTFSCSSTFALLRAGKRARPRRPRRRPHRRSRLRPARTRARTRARRFRPRTASARRWSSSASSGCSCAWNMSVTTSSRICAASSSNIECPSAGTRRADPSGPWRGGGCPRGGSPCSRGARASAGRRPGGRRSARARASAPQPSSSSFAAYVLARVLDELLDQLSTAPSTPSSRSSSAVTSLS